MGFIGILLIIVDSVSGRWVEKHNQKLLLFLNGLVIKIYIEISNNIKGKMCDF